MRLFFLLVAFANLMFFAWAQGYFGSAEDGREPQRLAQQLHPEKLRIVPLAPQQAAKADEIACRLVSGLGSANAAALGAAIEAAGGKATISPVAPPEHFVVFIGDLVGKAVADRKFAELTRLGLEGHKLLALSGENHEIRLGEFPTDVAAREFLQGIAKRNVKSARVEIREQAPVNANVEVRAPLALIQRQLPQLVAAHADATVGECAAKAP